jgi:hypothetical protein
MPYLSNSNERYNQKIIDRCKTKIANSLKPLMMSSVFIGKELTNYDKQRIRYIS